MVTQRVSRDVSAFIQKWAAANHLPPPKPGATDAEVRIWIHSLDADKSAELKAALGKSSFEDEGKKFSLLAGKPSPPQQESEAYSTRAQAGAPIDFADSWPQDPSARAELALSWTHALTTDPEKRVSLARALRSEVGHQHLAAARSPAEALLLLALDPAVGEGPCGVNLNRRLDLGAAGLKAALDRGEPFPTSAFAQLLTLALELPLYSYAHSAEAIGMLLRAGLEPDTKGQGGPQQRAQMLLLADLLGAHELDALLQRIKPADGLLGEVTLTWDETPVTTTVLHRLSASTIEALAKKGFNLDEQDAQGNTALHNLAGMVWTGSRPEEVARNAATQAALLRHGASAHLANQEGRTAAQVARSLEGRLRHLHGEAQSLEKERFLALTQAPGVEISPVPPAQRRAERRAVEETEAFLRRIPDFSNANLHGAFRSARAMKILTETEPSLRCLLYLLADSAGGKEPPTDLKVSYCTPIIAAALDSDLSIDFTKEDGRAVALGTYLHSDAALTLKLVARLEAWLQANPKTALPPHVAAMALGAADQALAEGELSEEGFDAFALKVLARTDKNGLEIPFVEDRGNRTMSPTDVSVYALASLRLTKLLLASGVPVPRDTGKRPLASWPQRTASRDQAAKFEYIEKYELLKAHGLDPAATDAKGENVATLFASANWLAGHVQYLLEHGVPADDQGLLLSRLKDAQALEVAVKHGARIPPELSGRVFRDWSDELEAHEVPDAERAIRALVGGGADPFQGNLWVRARSALAQPLPADAGSYDRAERRGQETFVRVIEALVSEGKLKPPAVNE